MKSTLETVAFFKTLRTTLDSMSDEDAGKLMKALFAYDDGEDPDLAGASPTVKAVYPMAAESLERLTKKRMSKVRPQTDRKQSANVPQTDRKDTAHNHSHNLNHPSIEGYMGRNPKIQRAYGFSTERPDVNYDEIVRERLRKEAEE